MRNGVASAGSDDVVLRVRDVATGRDVDGPFERNHWYGSPLWSPDGRVLFYRQFHELPANARPSDYLRDQRVLRHRISEPTTRDVPVFSAAAVGKDSLLLAILTIDARAGLAIGGLNSGVESYSWQFFTAPLADVTQGRGSWRPLFTHADSVGALAVHGSDVYVLTYKNAPLGRIVRATLADPELENAGPVMPEASYSITEMSAALDGLYVLVFAEGVNRIARIPWGGAPQPLVLPPGTSVESLQADPLRSGISLTLTSTTSARRAYRYDPALDAIRELPLRTLGPGDRLEGFVTETVFAPGHDGIDIPRPSPRG